VELDWNNEPYPYKGYRYNCSRCEQEFELDVFLSKLIAEGDTEVELALCHDCMEKLCSHLMLPFYAPDFLSCH